MKIISIRILAASLFFSAFFLSHAQEQRTSEPVVQKNPNCEYAPGVNPAGLDYMATPPALWDIQFVYDTQDSSNYGGQAGVVFTGTEFWVSRWSMDSILTFDSNGSFLSEFTIPGLTGVRAFTWDGTSIYAVNNTNTIYEIDPSTHMLVSQITAPMTQIRHCTYDSTANGGAGGFWIGNWATDLVQINMAGIQINTITAATHGLTGMYGSAFDNQTAGGPYLWIFNQGGANNTDIVRLQLPAGNQTLVVHDAMSDIGPLEGLSAGLAGGLFITDELVAGQWTIGGIIQGTPNDILFGYELNDYVPPTIDGSLDSVAVINRYTQIPLSHAGALSFVGVVSNMGVNTINTINFELTLKRGATTVFTDTQSQNNLASGSDATLVTGNYTATQTGTYTAQGAVTLTGQTDLVSGNNQLNYQFEVTDSTIARDDGNANGNDYNVGGTDWAYVTSNFYVPVADTLTSVWIRLETPVDGDSTFGVVAAADLDGIPLNLVAITPVKIIQAGTTDYVLVFPGGVPVVPGFWAIGCYEQTNSSINLAQSNNVFTQNVNYYYVPSSGWVPSGIASSRFIRPNFGNVSTVGVSDPQAGAQLNTWPVPATDVLNISFESQVPGSGKITMTDITGKTVLVQAVSVREGKNQVEIHTATVQPGIYLATLEVNGKSATRKFVVGK